MSSPATIPVIDLFAGPGGLSEGFSRHGERDWSELLSDTLESSAATPRHRKTRFEVKVSVEKDETAHQTLELRALVRLLKDSGQDHLYWSFLRNGTRAALFEKAGSAAAKASAEAWCATLGPDLQSELDQRIRRAIPRPHNAEWVLIGGPPCQAYSLAGRSRNAGKPGYRPEDDDRHFLYREYLRIVAEHRPTVFVMENVKGLLSSKVSGESMFEKIEADLRRPDLAIYHRDDGLRYELYPVVATASQGAGVQLSLPVKTEPADFVVRMESRGIPQARHRLILLGVRSDVGKTPKVLLPARKPVFVEDALRGLPRLRSGLSEGEDTADDWMTAMKAAGRASWLAGADEAVRMKIQEVLDGLSSPKLGRGAEFLERDPKPGFARSWYCPDGFAFILNHTTRSHIEGDIHRYLFAASWGVVHGVSPTLAEFPTGLRPKHRNAALAARDGGLFGDRFRVQVAGRPSTTVTSHISKDGHYYIHFDPAQGRSLTVREAARLQTFPDDYFFCGPRTEQYHQVGNAVPPLLATQIAAVVAELLA